ncbi:hypothetical protein NUACC21_07680 [Scytonema sp. NUACC21]
MLINMNEIEKIRTECLAQLKKLEREINSSTVQLFWEDKKRNPEKVKKFFIERRAIVASRAKLENAILARIARSLSELEDDLKEGCKNLQTQIDKLDNEIAFLNVISRVSGILAKILLIV